MHASLHTFPAANAENDEISGMELRVLISAPTGRDASLIVNLLRSAGLAAESCSGYDEVEQEMTCGAGAVILAEESLREQDVERLRSFLMRQPSWSDFPLILLTKGGKVSPATVCRNEAYVLLGNVLLLERPVRPETLISTVQGTLRSRKRQYEIRNYLLQQAQAEAALRQTEKLAVTGRLAASIAHEINNPLEAVTNLLFLLRSHIRDSGTEYLNTAESEVERIANITKQTLAFHRENGKAEAVNLLAVIEDVLKLLEVKAAKRKITVVKNLDQLQVQAIPGELRQLFLNLIDNAISAAPVGGSVRIAIVDQGKSARVSITDNGSGIARENIEKVFQPFFTTKSLGTGLGLWVAQGIAAKFGGNITVESRTEGPLHGATFYVTFNRAAWQPRSNEGVSC
jgi:signal transduction histidine kinase